MFLIERQQHQHNLDEISGLKRFTAFKNMLEEGCSGENIPLNYDEKQITLYTVRMLLLQAEDLTKDRLFSVSFHNSIGLIQLAEKLEACDALKDKVAQIHYDDHIYDILHRAAFSTQNIKESEFEPEAARQWFVRCIPKTSDGKKLELRRILYPLQYTSVAFTALKNKALEVCNTIKWNQRTQYHELQEFKIWQDSFEHKAYCATKPSNALSCTEFNSIKQENKVTLQLGQKPDEYGIVRKRDKLILFACRRCGTKKKVSWFKPDDIEILACNTCVKENLAGKAVDLSDCYNLDKVSLHRLMNHAYYHTGAWNQCDQKTSEAHEYLVHLPQIHLPLLKLLLKYKSIDCCEHGDGAHGSNAHFTFGTNTLELYPIDIKALESFASSERHTTSCIFNLTTKNDVIPLTSELAKLRKDEGFMVRFQTPDADLSLEKWNGCYPAVYRNDRWLIRGVPLAVDLFIKIIGAMVIWHFISKAYNQQWNIYLKQLNTFADTVPHDVKTVASYLSANQNSIWGKNVGADLPKELSLPSFSGNAYDIRLPDTNTAMTAINQLQAIQSTHQPTYGWHGIQFFVLGCIGMISKMFLDSMCAKFAKPGIVKSTLQLLGFIEHERDIACYMQIVQLKKEDAVHQVRGA